VSAAGPIARADRRRSVVRVRVRRPIAAGRLQTALRREQRRRRRRLGAVRGRFDGAVREDGRRARQTVGRRKRRDGRPGGPVQRARDTPEIVGTTAVGRSADHRRGQQICRTSAQRRQPL